MMTDIIWGNVAKIVTGDIFELNVTHRKDGNRNDYSDSEKIKILQIDYGTISNVSSQRTKEGLEQLVGQFIKCEIESRNSDDNNLTAKISHSGAGGY